MTLMAIIYPKRFITCLLLLTGIHGAFAQRVIDNAELKLGKEVNTFINKVQLVSPDKQKPVALNDGNYKINNSVQKASITLRNKLINGTISVREDDHTRTDYVILNSTVQSAKTFTDEVMTVDINRKDAEVHFKEYYVNGKIKAEGYMSLDQKKHYGKGITKSYDEDGKLQKISNDITETYTDFYPNGYKKSVSGPNIQETYNETGAFSTRQYRKNNIRYVDEYADGKLSTRSYDNADKSEVKEYYSNGLLQKKEVIKSIQGKLRLLIYNKAGNLVNNEPYEPASQINH